MITAIIMAAGYSKRMKKDKLLLEYRGKTLAQQTLDKVLACGFSQIILVVREGKNPPLRQVNRVKVIENKNADKGISESIKLGITYAEACEGYMFFTIDQPLLNTNMINKLLEAFNQHKNNIIVPHYQGRRGSPVIFPEKFKQALMDLEGDIGGKTIINNSLEEVHFVEMENARNLFDVDTQEDYEKILQWDGIENDF